MVNLTPNYLLNGGWCVSINQPEEEMPEWAGLVAKDTSRQTPCEGQLEMGAQKLQTEQHKLLVFSVSVKKYGYYFVKSTGEYYKVEPSY